MRLGALEIVLILVVVLVLFGGNKLAGVARPWARAFVISRRKSSLKTNPRKSRRRNKPKEENPCGSGTE